MAMKHCLISFCTIILLFGSTPVRGEEKPAVPDSGRPAFTLNDLYKNALNHAETIRQAEEDVTIAEKDRRRALAVLFPRFTAFGAISRTDIDQETVYAPNTNPVLISSPNNLSLKTDTTTWGVRLDQSFTLNGKELVALKITGNTIEKSRYDLTAVKEAYLFDVATAYYGVLRASRGVAIAKANVERLQRHKQSVETRLRLAEITKTDLYRAESELSDANAKLTEEKNLYLFARATLATLVEMPADFVLAEPNGVAPENLKTDLENLMSEGLSRRAEIKSAELLKTVSKQSVSVARGDYWPTLTLEGQYTDNKDANSGSADTYPVDIDQDKTGYVIGAKLTFTLFDAGLRNAGVKQALSREKKAELLYEQTRKKIALEIQDAYLNMMTEKSRLVSLGDKLTFSRNNFNAVTEQFKHGLSNSLDMMDANTLLVSSERGLSDAEFSYKLAVLRLKRATGSFLGEVTAAMNGEKEEKN